MRSPRLNLFLKKSEIIFNLVMLQPVISFIIYPARIYHLDRISRLEHRSFIIYHLSISPRTSRYGACDAPSVSSSVPPFPRGARGDRWSMFNEKMFARSMIGQVQTSRKIIVQTTRCRLIIKVKIAVI